MYLKKKLIKIPSRVYRNYNVINYDDEKKSDSEYDFTIIDKFTEYVELKLLKEYFCIIIKEFLTEFKIYHYKMEASEPK